MEVTIFSTTDWEVVFINGAKMLEGHSTSTDDLLTLLTVMPIENGKIAYNHFWLEQEDMEDLAGCENIKEFLKVSESY